MHTYPRRTRVLATSLAALAGAVDAMGYLLLGGFFVSFMSGNSTRLGVGLATGSRSVAMAATLIATFVSGVVIGSLLGRTAGSHRRPVVLALVATLLALAAGGGAGHRELAGVAMSLAMGAENAVFEADGGVRFGLTYMTGTLVKLGQRIATALLGGAREDLTPYLMLWMGLAAGGAAGAYTFERLGFAALWIAAAAAAALALAAALLGPDLPDSESLGANGVAGRVPRPG